MFRTYGEGIEGWLESVPRLYKSLIERKKRPRLKEKIAKKNQNVYKLVPGDSDWDFEDLF